MFSTVATLFYIPTNSVQRFQILCVLANTSYSPSSFIKAIIGCVKVILHVLGYILLISSHCLKTRGVGMDTVFTVSLDPDA